MSVNNAIMMIEPVVLAVNVATMFLCFRTKRGIPFTVAALAIYGAAVHFFLNRFLLSSFLADFGGVVVLPMMLWLFKGRPYQKVFAFFMQYQLTTAKIAITDALVGATIGTQSNYAQATFFVISLLPLGVYMLLVWRFGRRLFERLFVEGDRRDWIINSFGAVFSFMLMVKLRWQTAGIALYISLVLFILWSFAVLCFTIVKTHEKAAHEHQAKTLGLQMDSMREQIEADKKHRAEMKILRHDIRHEAGVIAELYRAGKAAEAEAVYTRWQNTLLETSRRGEYDDMPVCKVDIA